MAGELGALVRQWRECKACALAAHRRNVAFGRGWRVEGCHPDVDPLVLVVGESPGRVEDEVGSPWSGATQEILVDHYLKQGGIHQAWLADAVACRPVAGANPSVAEAKSCAGHLTGLAPILPFAGVLLVGRFAMDAFDAGLWPEYQDLPKLYVPHPSALLRQGWPHNEESSTKCAAAVEAIVAWMRKLGAGEVVPAAGPEASAEAAECNHDWAVVGAWTGERVEGQPMRACTRCAVIEKPKFIRVAKPRAPRKTKAEVLDA